VAIVQIAFLFLFRWTRFRCTWNGRWKCFQSASAELWGASLSLVGYRELHDNILNGSVNAYVHTERYDGFELRHLGWMLLYNGFNIRNAPSRYDNTNIRETKPISLSPLFDINHFSHCSSNTGLSHLKRKKGFAKVS